MRGIDIHDLIDPAFMIDISWALSVLEDVHNFSEDPIVGFVILGFEERELEGE